MKNNKLIAEFMGISIDGEFAYIEDEGSPLEEVIPINKLNYHNSWDWLMPVIIKMADAREDTHYKLYKTIDEAYEEVVEFIKTYNDERQ